MKPPLLPPRLEGIPETLKTIPRWLVWRPEWVERPDLPEGGKWNKIPIDAKTGGPGSSTDPATWAPFSVAWDKYASAPRTYGGVGFVLSADDSIMGGDCDHVITDRTPSPEAAGYVSSLPTYWEVSPSGRGLRWFAIASKPAGSCKRGDLEMYEAGRYLTVTGRKWNGTAPDLQPCQEEVNRLFSEWFPPKPAPDRSARSVPSTPATADDTELLHRATTAGNGAKIAALLGGDTSGHGGDHSAADLALCTALAFWTGDDPARLDRLFRASGLMREKWDVKHHADGSTYGQETIRKAIEGCGEFYEWDRPRGEAAARDAITREARRAGSEAPPPPSVDAPAPPAREYNPTDAGNAERLIDHHREKLRHVRAMGWRTYNGRFWESGEDAVIRLARETVRTMYGDAAELLSAADRERDKDLRKALATRATDLSRHALRSEATGRLKAMVEQARSFAEITVEPAAFDLRAWVAPFANGVWDCGEWRTHRAEDYTDRLLPVVYEPAADRSEWYALLERMTGGDTDFAGTLQDVAGYALSGASSLRRLPWLYGPKGSGKSTFAELLQTVMGEYTKALDWALVSGDRDAEALGRAVRNTRAVFLPEAGRRRVDPEILKLLSGSDRLPCRELYQSGSFSVPPTWAVIATSNDAPNLTAYDDALRDRVVALPFVHPIGDGGALAFTGGRRLEEARRDPSSPLARGFAAWAVDGLARIHRTQEIRIAPAAEEHTRRFWVDADQLAPFWGEIAEEELRAGITAGELRQRYLSWCASEGIHKPLGTTAWGKACHGVGLDDYRTKTSRWWKLLENRTWDYKGDEVDPKMTQLTPFSEKSPRRGVTKGTFPEYPLTTSPGTNFVTHDEEPVSVPLTSEEGDPWEAEL